MSEAALKIAEPEKFVRLDLGAGQNPREGFQGVDFHAPNPDQRVDLFKFPWPWADNSVDELHSSHFVEHLPAREVEARDISRCSGIDTYSPEVFNKEREDRFIGQDFFLAFFDECYRILKPGGKMTVIVPCGRSSRGFQDPTHRRFIMAETFAYLAKDWRDANKLDHYKVRCDFGSNVVPTVPTELTLLHPEAQARRFNEGWNTIVDWHATLISKKPA